MELLQNGKVYITKTITIWDNIYGCSDKYRCATALHLLSMLSHAYNIVVYFGVVAPIHGKYVVDVLDATDQSFLNILITTVQLPVASTKYS